MTVDDVLARLPPFERHTRRRAVEGLLARGVALCEGAQAALGERAVLEERLSEASRWVVEGQGDRTAALVRAWAHVRGEAPDRAASAAIRAGRLGLDVLIEFVRRRQPRLESEALVALHAGQEEPGWLELAGRCLEDRSWRLVHSAFELLSQRTRAGAAVPREAADRALQLAGAPAEAVWAQAAALRYLATFQRESAVPILLARLTPRETPDDFFVRAEAWRALGDASPGQLVAALGTIPPDPSEHVRMTRLAVAAQFGRTDAVLEAADRAREPSPRVRAVAFRHLAQLAPTQLVPPLRRETDPLVQRAALQWVEPHAASVPELAAWMAGLARLGASADVRRLAAEACERLHHASSEHAHAALASLRSAIEGVREKERALLLDEFDPAVLGRAMSVAATDDFGLEGSARAAGWRVQRGDRLRRRLWRALHEVLHPSPDKRQGALHTLGRVPSGDLRAPPGRLAEVTATRVPGERVWAPAQGDWGRHLPTVDDLLSFPRKGVFALFSPWGTTVVRRPPSSRRVAAWLELTLHYERYAQLRWKALTAVEPRERREYVEALRQLGFVISLAPWRELPDEVQTIYGSEPASEAVPAATMSAGFGPLLPFLLDGSRNTLNHLAAVSVAALGLFYARLAESRRQIEQARSSLPLSIGGWGTRGKSGTERIKAGLFQGLGCEVLVKTTGCEAMFIHAVPDVPANEVFIYRTYDKATVWEQKELLSLASRFGVDVFLWECMALNPTFVEMLEQRWMKDDFCTITNTYPDHENIQGPAGIDIPRVMVNFLPRGRMAFTAEEQMLPILREGARERSTELVEVRWEDAALLPEDLLARFPYEEHPRNIALVLALAEGLGVDRTMAIKEMADNVVPDLGVLRTYPEARWRGRRLVFSNGMSANERTGFMNNWVRCGFDRHQPDDIGEWIVTVVNNRGDRVSRSVVFADIVVQDATAHAQILIGTNLEGLTGFIRTALAPQLAALVLFHPDETRLPPEEQLQLAWSRAERAFARVKLGRLGPERLAAEAAAMAVGLGVPDAVAKAPPSLFAEPLSAAPSGQPLTEAVRARLAPALEAYETALGPEGTEAKEHLLRLAAQHAEVLALQTHVRQAVESGGAAGLAACEEEFRSLYARLFESTIVSLWDSKLSGDQIVDAIARASPPGFRVRIMGIQNIKGTGLDFAYRWVHFDQTVRALEMIKRASGAESVRRAQALAEAEGIGLLDCIRARDDLTLLAARARDAGEPQADELQAVARRFEEKVTERTTALQQVGGEQGGRFATVVERVADIYDGVFRRRRADRVVDELVRGHLSHKRAATIMQELMARQKGGWLFKA